MGGGPVLIRARQLAPALDALMGPYRDPQDPGPFLLTHVFLLVGAALPVWLSPPPAPLIIAPPAVHPFAGVLAVVVGDGVAAVVGSRLGRVRWFESKKTLEGSVAAWAAQLAVVYALAGSTSAVPPLSGRVAAALAVGAIFEAVTTQLDNLVLPLVVFAWTRGDPAAWLGSLF